MGLLGGFLLTFFLKAERKAFTVDAQMTAPNNFKIPVKNFDDLKQGGSSVGTPGSLKGLWEIHQKYGHLSWKSLLEPTINMCYDGIVITKHLHDSMHINSNIANDSYLRELFMEKDSEKFKRPGMKFIPKKQCKFLEILANHTEADIYSAGAVVDLVLNDFYDAGSVINRDDLIKYKVKWTESIEFPLNEEDSIFVPNTAAVLVPAVINIMKQYSLNSSSFDSVRNLNDSILTHHRIVEAFKHVFAVRSELGDPDYIENVEKIVNYLLSTAFAKQIKSQIDDVKTYNSEKYSAKFLTPNNDGTSHISIIAENGDAISVTSSINY